MHTDSVPYPVDGLIAKLHAHTKTDPPAPSTIQAGLPRGFDDVVGRALAKDPSRRYRTAGELAVAAERALRTAPRRPPRAIGSRRTGVLAVGGVIVVALLAVLVVALTSAQRDSTRARSIGRTLPAAPSLRTCGDLLTAPAGDCRGATGGVDVLARRGTTARMRTMDFKVTRVIQSRAILDPYSQDTVTAPRGYRFILIECAITNRLPASRVFEPIQFAGRQTALYLYTSAGDRVSPNGPRFTDYSEQNLPAIGLIPFSLLDRRLPPSEPGDVPCASALAFSYPVSDLQPAPSMLLFVHEFGRGLGDEHSIGVFRLTISHSQVRAVYKAPEI
jgi:hypothetical protein